MTDIVLGNLLLTAIGAALGGLLVTGLFWLKIRQFISLDYHRTRKRTDARNQDHRR